MFIDDENLNKVSEIMQGKDHKFMGWRLFFSMLKNRGMRYEWFV